MERLLDNFTEIFNKEIKLHKKIKDDDIRLIYGESRKSLYIIDINDIINNNNVHMNKTEFVDTLVPFIRFSYYGYDFNIYSYLNFRTTEEMNEDHHIIQNFNVFLKSSTYKKELFIIAKLNKVGELYYISYYINNDVLEDIKKNKRNYRINVLIEMLINDKREKIYKENNKNLSLVLNRTYNYELFSNVLSEEDDLLKRGIKLYNYQINDINWMNCIEMNIKNDRNIIKFSYSPTYNVLNDECLLYNYSLFPTELINEKYKNDVTFRYYGGNLISEMGLGKTLITLYYIFKKNDNIYNNFVEYSDNCNYFYKRGKLKGKVCKNNCEMDKLYCKEHINSLFIDKRDIILRNLSEFNPLDCVIKRNNSLYIKTNSTLIICPNQLCDQWLQEYYDKFKKSYRIVMIVTYDQYRNVTLADILFSDMIIVSYNFLLNSRYINNTYNIKKNVIEKFMEAKTEEKLKELLNSQKFNKFDLFYWERVICDEVHEIETMLKGNVLHKYIVSLKSDYKWNITGTPFPNNLQSFINLMSYNTNYLEKCMINDTNNYSTDNLINMGLNGNIIEKSSILFKRDTKQSIVEEFSGNDILDYVKLLDFTDQERSIYDSYLEGSKKKYSDFLIRLCCHPELSLNTRDLIKNCKSLDEIQNVMLDWNKRCLDEEIGRINVYKNDIEYYQGKIDVYTDIQDNVEIDIELFKTKVATLKRQLTIHKKNYEEYSRTYNYLKSCIESLINKNESMICPICLDDIEEDNITITKCGHKFCWDCIYQTHNVQSSSYNNNGLIKCPSCNTLMTNKEIYLLHERELNKIDGDLDKIINDVKSTKIGNIIYFLKTSLQKNDKVILFSQWDELLHKIGDILLNNNINIVYCNGSVYQRKRAIMSFYKNSNINVILLSSRNAASGINLTVANKIILLEPIYGNKEYRYNIESQAIGRADRIGQKNSINVYRFIIKDTIEQDIINNFIDDNKIKQLQIT